MKFISAVAIILFVSNTTGQDTPGPCDDEWDALDDCIYSIPACNTCYNNANDAFDSGGTCQNWCTATDNCEQGPCSTLDCTAEDAALELCFDQNEPTRRMKRHRRMQTDDNADCVCGDS